jgi:threonine dehydrogenase-like Zn-dependent dehydrogenase
MVSIQNLANDSANVGDGRVQEGDPVSTVLRFAAPRRVEVVEHPVVDLAPGQVRVRTLHSGISAGTELTAYRGTNPYLTRAWDPELRLFTDEHEAQPGYPLDGWGYSEVGEVTEVAPSPEDAPRLRRPVAVGDIVWGIWGHRSEGVLLHTALDGHQLPPGVDPLAGAFVRVGAIALNAVLAADLGVGTTVVVFGQGVIGLLATRYATLNGATVVAVDGIQARRDYAWGMGAAYALPPDEGLARRIRELTAGAGADVAIELSGSYRALAGALTAVGADGTVVASGFYQGSGEVLRLGEEFHHNRVQLLASQIGSVPNRLRARWDVPRLQRTVVQSIADHRLDPLPLVSHRYRLEDAAEAYELLDENPSAALQVVLDFA